MFSKVKWRCFKKYSGPLIRGTTDFKLKKDSDHWDRVLWLTSMVETGGKFGTTVGYDGTGNTSGLIQCIGVFPAELAHEDNNPEDDQGCLWKALEYIRIDCPELLDRLDNEFLEIGWELQDGLVWKKDTDVLVNGRDLREELTPNQGQVSKFGSDWQEAKNWALMFHDIFSDPRSFDGQIKFGIDHLQGVARRRPRVLAGRTAEALLYNGDARDTKLFSLADPMDLAAAVLFSNSVNAPAMAFRKLKQALNLFQGKDNRRPNWQRPSDRRKFARILIRVLGKANYARWNFKIVTGRYQRTRKAARNVWSEELFSGRRAIMPKTFYLG